MMHDGDDEWEECTSDITGDVYYYNTRTNKSTWKVPPKFASNYDASELDVTMTKVLEDDIQLTARAVSGIWSMHSKDSKIFYFNRISQKSVWSRPNDFDDPVSAQIRNTSTTTTQEKTTSSVVTPSEDTKAKLESFRKMLSERRVNQSSTWKEFLPRIAVDPRFTAVQGMAVRKSIFEHFVKNFKSSESTKESAPKTLRAFAQFLATPETLKIFRKLSSSSISLPSFLSEMPSDQSVLVASVKSMSDDSVRNLFAKRVEIYQKRNK